MHTYAPEEQLSKPAKQMLNITSARNSTSLGTNVILFAIIISSVGIIFDFILIILLVHDERVRKHSTRNTSRRVGLLHSINTYTHLIGTLTTLLLMCTRTLYSDLHGETHDEYGVSWHCHFLAYCLSLFGAGVYGSCFLQALFRFWRIVLPGRAILQKPSLHAALIVGHWIFIILSLLPTLGSSVYIVSDHFCLIPFNNILSGVYTSTIVALIPVSGLFILYIKIIRYLKQFSRNQKLRRRIRRDVFLIRRIFLLVIIIVQTSSSGIILWIVVLIDPRFLLLFYRHLRFVIILCMLTCSITLFAVSPQLNRVLRSKTRKSQSSGFSSKQDIPLNRLQDSIPS